MSKTVLKTLFFAIADELIDEYTDDIKDHIRDKLGLPAAEGDPDPASSKAKQTVAKKAAADRVAKASAAATAAQKEGGKQKRGGNTVSKEEMQEAIKAVSAIDKKAAREILDELGVDKLVRCPMSKYDDVYNAANAWLEENEEDDL